MSGGNGRAQKVRESSKATVQEAIAAAREGAKGLPKTQRRYANGHAEDWTSELQESQGEFRGNEHNILLALRKCPDLAGLVRFNEFALTVEPTSDLPWRKVRRKTNRWTDTDDIHFLAWLQERAIKARGKNVVCDCVEAVARENGYHPVLNYLKALEWDGESRLDTWLKDYLGAEGDSEYLQLVGRKSLIAAVARVMCPGSQVDTMLVFEGLQGIGKTNAVRTLAVKPEWFAGSLPDIGTKDSMIQLCGRWMVEIAELKSIKSREVEAVKSFFTQCVDTFRPPYGRRAEQVPRQCVFVGTTNESEYLQDRTGNRRFWPVRCGQIDLKRLRADCDQLWAEAFHAYRHGEAWHLDEEEDIKLAEREQEKRVTISQTEQDIAAYLLKCGKERVSTREIYTQALKMSEHSPGYRRETQQLGTQVGGIMQRCGWEKDKRAGKGKTRGTLYIRKVTRDQG